MKSLRIYILDTDLVEAIEKKADKWNVDLDEAVVKILRVGLSDATSNSKDLSQSKSKKISKTAPELKKKIYSPKASK